ncbi:hypothetical protein SAMN03097699_0403 [Flavobacteriaceae bacterium MAR_2010_188]|nr:hypothetical protein SAMN03097699_0403 [Flavobacteriaceae bacterium MAR_2010_188]
MLPKSVGKEMNEMMHDIALRCAITLYKAPFMCSNLYIPKTCQHSGKTFTASTTVTNYFEDTCSSGKTESTEAESRMHSNFLVLDF